MQTATAETRPQMTLQHYFVQAGVRDELEFAKSIVMNPEMPPMKHQISGLNQTLAYDRFALYDEPGCGKTMIAQAAALYMAGYGNKVVVVMPPVLLEQFEEELDATFYGWRDYFTMHRLIEGPDKRAELFAKWREHGWPDIMCMSYQQFAKLPRSRKRKNKTDEAMNYDGQRVEPGEWYKLPPNPDDYISGVLKKAGYNYLIGDEAHALKNASSNQHKAVQYLIGKGTDGGLLLMTGTPIPNELIDAYGMIELTSPGSYASKKSFERLHCLYTTTGDGWSQLIGYQNQDTISVNLYKRARRVTKDQVLDLKEPQVIEVPVNLEESHYKLYKKLIKERFLEMGEEVITALNQQALRQKSLQIITTPEHFTDKKMPNAIIATVDELLDSIGMRTEKVVVFANFQRSVEALRDHFIKEGLNPAVIYGGKGDNEANKRKFLKDDSCRVLVANPRSGGYGLNLQKVCRWVIFAEPTSVPGDFTQASERVYRKGQDKVVTMYILKALGTISPKLTKNMVSKAGDTKYVTGDPTTLLDELMGTV